MLPPGIADCPPVMDRGSAGRYLGLRLSDVDRVCLGLLLQSLQALLGLLERLLGLPQSTEDAQRIALG